MEKEVLEKGSVLCAVAHSKVSHLPAPVGPVVFLRHIDLGLKFWWTSVGNAAFLTVVVVVKKVAKVLSQHILLTNGHTEWLFIEPEMSLPCLVSQNPNT